MADAKISELPAASSVSGTDEFAINQAGTTRKATATQFNNFAGAGLPVGVLAIWGTDTAPTGWLLCYGQAVSRTTYAGLFAVVGTAYGTGDGSTTFNLPDLRGRVPLGQDDMGGSSANRVTAAAADTLGSSGGAETHTLAASEIPAHTHPPPAGTTAFFYTPSGAGGVAYAAGTNMTTNANTGSNTGGGGAHNNTQPYITLNYIIYAAA